MPPPPAVVIRRLPGLTDYASAVAAMQRFANERQPDTADEIWLLEHPPVYTLGLNTDPAHLLGTGTIPVIQTDRGGQVTYHGPGQLIAYVMIDLARARLGIRQVVTALETAVIRLAASHGITAAARRDAPGVYVDGAKLASLGLRVRRGTTYHGLALNVAMDLAPFHGINPCGQAGLTVTSLAELGVAAGLDETAEALLTKLKGALFPDSP
ncbi:MAG: lipoyl(octanoyl) transferase LipB [Gammaproteobacteria bacterium]|jgi:lipoyl(octanoyl) transferase|nr:lipoyl(octanoyl) transferase LipB [Gammaproteobacteria bacterium]